MTVTPYLFREATPAELEAVVNPALATMLAVRLIGTEVDAVQIVPAYLKNVFITLTTDTESANVIVNPYKFKTFAAAEDNGAQQLARNFIAANPTYFFSPMFAVYRPAVTDPNQSTVVGLFYNEDSTEGYSNWGYAAPAGGGGPPTGAAGGDLSGTYPAPIVGPTTTGSTLFAAMVVGANTIGTFAIASVQDAEWEVVLTKGNTRYSCTVRANIGDGVTAEYGEQDTVISPAIGGTFDVPLTVSISGANMLLVATPASLGWSARVRAHTFAV